MSKGVSGITFTDSEDDKLSEHPNSEDCLQGIILELADSTRGVMDRLNGWLGY